MMKSTHAVVRIIAADEDDGDPLVDCRDGLITAELRIRDNQDGRATLEKVYASELLLIVHAGTIRSVGTIESVEAVIGRVTIGGALIDNHALIGHPDPFSSFLLDARLAYGRIMVEADGHGAT